MPGAASLFFITAGIGYFLQIFGIEGLKVVFKIVQDVIFQNVLPGIIRSQDFGLKALPLLGSISVLLGAELS